MLNGKLVLVELTTRLPVYKRGADEVIVTGGLTVYVARFVQFLIAVAGEVKEKTVIASFESTVTPEQAAKLRVGDEYVFSIKPASEP